MNIGSGTLYDLLEQFAAEGIILETKAEGRRRSYVISEKGRQMLEREYERLRRQTADYERIIQRRRNHERKKATLYGLVLL